MFKRSFTVRAFWDDEAKVYYSDSDIIGLHLEAETLDEFESILMELGPALIAANHMDQQVVENISPANFADFIPTILWQRPVKTHVMA